MSEGGKQNPFEVRVSKKRFHTLNQKNKGHVVNSTAAASEGMKKRKKHLLTEFRSRGKAGAFVDRRLGEADADELTVEQKMELRLRRVREQKARSMFSLQEDGDITHLGHNIGASDLNDPLFFKVGEDEDFGGGEGGLLDAETVNQLHFGGGEEEGHRKKSKREIMNEIIARSKQAKYERKVEREEMSMLSSKLDSQYADVADLLERRQREPPTLLLDDDEEEQQEQDGQDNDSYDELVSQLRDEERSARAGKRLRTDEELAKGRIAFMKQQEMMRIKRMQDRGPTMEEEAEEEEAEDDDVVDMGERGTRVWYREQDEEFSSGIDEEDTSVPFLINVPNSYDEFAELMAQYRSKRRTVVSRMISLHHPSIKPQYVNDLQRLQLLLLISMLRCGNDGAAARDWVEVVTKGCARVLRVAPSARGAQEHPLNPSKSPFYVFRLIVQIVCTPAGAPPPPRHPDEGQLYGALREVVDADAWATRVLLCRVFPRLFPFSDAAHPLSSPLLMYLCSTLTQPHTSAGQVAKSLYVSDSLVSVLEDGGRLAPEPVMFVNSLLSDEPNFFTSSVARPLPEKVAGVAHSLQNRLVSLWRTVSPSTLHASGLPVAQPVQLHPLRLRSHKPVPVRTYEPLMEKGDKLKQMRNVRRAVKRETRAAARELKRDREFLNVAKREEYEAETASRAQALKGIVGFLQDQAGEAKMLKRIKQQELKM